MTWLENLTEEKRDTIVTMAQKRRRLVKSTIREDNITIRDQRIKKMEAEKKKAEEKEEKRRLEIEKLSSIPVIRTTQALQQEIETIDKDKAITIPGKEKKKLELLKDQVRIRNKLFNQPTKITFSTSGMQKTSDMLLQEVLDMLQRETQKRSNASTVNSKAKKTRQMATQYLSVPNELVGKDIVHRFVNDETEEEELWDGNIVAYDSTTNTHSIIHRRH